MQTLLLTLVLLAQQSGASLRLRVIDAAGQPLRAVPVALQLYVYDDQQARIWFEDDCRTDADGLCVFRIDSPPPQGGFLRGALRIGAFGVRDVLWPGGVLEISAPIDQIGVGREAQPYAFQQPDGGVEIVREGGFPLYALLIALLLGALIAPLYRRAREENA